MPFSTQAVVQEGGTAYSSTTTVPFSVDNLSQWTQTPGPWRAVCGCNMHSRCMQLATSPGRHHPQCPVLSSLSLLSLSAAPSLPCPQEPTRGLQSGLGLPNLSHPPHTFFLVSCLFEWHDLCDAKDVPFLKSVGTNR